MGQNYQWIFASKSEIEQNALKEKLGIDELIAQILINRGINDFDYAKKFLFDLASFSYDPFLMKDMVKAVTRIIEAINNKDKITIYGDYDVDGITATSLLILFLRSVADENELITYYIPERQSEGYGLNVSALEHLYQTGTKLVITVDCGISAIEEVRKVNQKLDIIITDHHQPALELPNAFAILNPKQNNCNYPYKELAGVGVAYKLCQAIHKKLSPHNESYSQYLEIVALGTIADIVPLTDENRFIVKKGLELMSKTTILGLQKLCEACGISDNIDTGKVGFVLAPKLNATGRLSHASIGVELLTSNENKEVDNIVQSLINENLQRQIIEKNLYNLVEEKLANIDIKNISAIVLFGEDWHSGVIGIVASKLVEKYYRPVIMISLKDGIGKGSCRSIPAYDIYQGLDNCKDLLVQFGGHKQAAGLTIEEKNISAFTEKLEKHIKNTLVVDDFIPKIKIDCLLSLDHINMSFVEQLACLEPFGSKNPRPVFAVKHTKANSARVIGTDGRHLKFKILNKNQSNDVIAWGMASKKDRLDNEIDIAFALEFNEWQGQRNIQLKACDIKEAEQQEDLVREKLKDFYILLRKFAINSQISRETLKKQMQQLNIDNDWITFIEIFKEINLVIEKSFEQHTIYYIKQVKHKLNLELSPTYIKIRKQQ